MTKHLFLFILLVGLRANALNAQISSLNCSASDSAGATSISLAGSYAGQTYLNITNINNFGIPFSQQAQILSASMVSNKLTLNLLTVLTQSRLRLTISNGTQDGRLSDQNNSSILLKCSATVSAAGAN